MSAFRPLLAAALLGLAPAALAQSIADARAAANGTTVTVTGTVSRVKGAYAYFQDGTGGLTARQTAGPLKDAIDSGALKAGCVLTVTGKVSTFNGLKQINAADLTSMSVGACGQTLTPQVVTAAQIMANGEAYEAQLVRVTGLSFVAPPTAPLAAATTYAARDASGDIDLRVPNASDSEVVGQNAPAPPFTFEGVVGQFASSGVGGYQLLAIGAGDLTGNPAVASTLAFGSASASVSEAAGTYAVSVALDYAASADVVAALSVTGGTATQGSDYTVPSPFTVTIPAGQRSGTAALTLVNDGVAEGPETVVLALSVQSGPATLGSPSTFTLTINDPGSAPGAGSVCPGLTGATLLTCIRSTYARTTVRSYSERTGFYTSYYGSGPYRCVYTGRYAPLGSSGDTQANTEHTWPQSKMPSQGTQNGDMHNLYITIASVNSDRGNLPFGDIATSQMPRWYGPTGTLGSTTPPSANADQYSKGTSTRFEPRDDHKGNVARAMAYFYALYGTNDASFWDATKPALMAWNASDPADDEERTRSTAIKAYQGNENPFVLDPTLIERAYFSSTAAEADEAAAGAFVAVSPNPARGRAVVSYRVPAVGTATVDLYDVTGRRVASAAPQAATPGVETQAAFDLSGLTPGVYLYRVSSGTWAAGGTFVVAR